MKALLVYCTLAAVCAGSAAAGRPPHGRALARRHVVRSAAPPSSAVRRAPTPVVCIDPGHPSETAAGAYENGVSETHVAWQVALLLRRHLEQMGIRCVLTKRTEGELVTNRERAEIANRAGAWLLLRLHCDAAAGEGCTFYYPDHAITKDGVTGPPQSVQLASREAAHVLDATARTALAGALRENPVRTDAATGVGSHQGGVLTGSVFARVPTVLVEMCDLNRRADARFIASAEGRERMAVALAAGVAAYVDRQRK